MKSNVSPADVDIRALAYRIILVQPFVGGIGLDQLPPPLPIFHAGRPGNGAIAPFFAKERFPADPWQLAFARNCGCGMSAVAARPAAAAIGN